eukprot:CAMPEP_0180472490 /NCGR_PEP_ID=MMETSP1036_2-20121128/29668_1 /TAXON_ID=632150 /ORGANISM="Azadinium spinosum, Strain 3D9" /LENGTH=107 /DNA_ID=CAMNT_0022479737 /DNA_START=160 /DNA_END=480 /DNA_ORIENTATION=+
MSASCVESSCWICLWMWVSLSKVFTPTGWLVSGASCSTTEKSSKSSSAIEASRLALLPSSDDGPYRLLPEDLEELMTRVPVSLPPLQQLVALLIVCDVLLPIDAPGG